MSSATHDLPYWLALAHCPKLGPRGFALLRAGFPTMAQAWQANGNKLNNIGLGAGIVEALLNHRRTLDVAASWAELEQLGISLVTIEHDQYPKLLKEIYDPPAVLFSRGNIEILSTLCLAVVGSRQATTYGLTISKEIASTLARAGITIVSGLAYGIDTSAHRATIEVGGKTVAVMASGLDQIYPPANRKLAQDILESGGLWLSEFPPHTSPLKQNFPFRNRIIAGLSQGTLVIEAPEKSGALLTAKHALESNREVFAVPGNTTSPTSAGTNELLKQGAHVVTGANDVLTVFGLKAEAAVVRQPLEPDLQALLEKLPYEPTHLESLIRGLDLPANKLTASLTLLELKGYIKDTGGQTYGRLK